MKNLDTIKKVITFAQTLDFVDICKCGKKFYLDIDGETEEYSEDEAFKLYSLCGKPASSRFGTTRFIVDGFEVVYSYE